MTISIQRVGGLANNVERIGGITTIAKMGEGGVASALIKVGGIRTRTGRYGGILCRMYQEVRSSLSAPYLEISPTVLWVLTGQSSDNDVYSNTDWNVD